jgi:hypothetical protein
MVDFGAALLLRAEPVVLMPVVRESISVSQLAELLGVEPWRLIDIEVHLPSSSARIVLEPEDRKKEEAHA